MEGVGGSSSEIKELLSICIPLVEDRRERWLNISLWQYFSAARKGEAFGLPSAPKYKVPETKARLERYLAEPWYRTTDKPNPGKDLIVAATLPSGIIDVSLWGTR